MEALGMELAAATAAAFLSGGLLAGAVAALWRRPRAPVLSGELEERRQERARSRPYRGFLRGLRLVQGWLPRDRWPMGGERLARVERRLEASGNRLALDPAEFTALQALGGALGALTAWLLDLGGVGAAGGAAGGVLLADAWLTGEIERRHASMLKDLPFLLDLLTLSVEAGMDFSTALARVGESAREGPLRAEIERSVREMRMGRSRGEALSRLAERTDLAELRTLVGAVLQADRMGTGLAEVLRVQSDDLRRRRFERAEKLAMEAPVKIVVPLLFVFVSVFLILFGGIVVDIARGRFF